MIYIIKTGDDAHNDVQEARTEMRSRKLAVATVNGNKKAFFFRELRSVRTCCVIQCRQNMIENANETAEKSSPNSSSTTAATTPRRHRYIRSSTAASVTQLLSDSCNSLLQRFRRNPSERLEKRANRSVISIHQHFFLLVFFPLCLRNGFCV